MQWVGGGLVAGEPIEYPNSSAGLPGSYATALFEMSSELTPFMIAAAHRLGLTVRRFLMKGQELKMASRK